MPFNRSATLSFSGLIEVGRESLVAVHPALQRHLVVRLEQRFLADAVHDAAGAAAAEDERVGSLEYLDAAQVVEIAVVLHIVAHAVDEEIRGAAVAADDDLVAVVFALMHGDARHVAHDVAHARHQLVLDQLLGHDGHRLRHVEQRRRRLRRGADDRHLIAAGRGADGDRLAHAGDLEDDLPRGTACGLGHRYDCSRKPSAATMSV